MDTHENDTLTEADVESWQDALDEVAEHLRPYFARSEAYEQAVRYITGLLSPAERKNSWQLAEIMGEATPYGFQHLLGRAVWEADTVGVALHAYVQAHLRTDDAILVVDETGFLKKGTKSAGVARQYSGTAGRVENCQIGVFVTYVSAQGHTMLDRELYLPQAWLDDPERCAAAGIPAARSFMTKPQLAQQMLKRVLAVDLGVAWVTGDSVYGDSPELRTWLETRQQPYVLGVSSTLGVTVAATTTTQSIRTLVDDLPPEAWETHSAGMGSKGPRLYEWHHVPLHTTPDAVYHPGLLLRRNRSDPSKWTAYRTYALPDTPLEELVRVAGLRWSIEVDLEAAKGEVGLDHYEVRSWTGWYRHITLALWTQALLAVIRGAALSAPLPKKGAPRPTRFASFKAQRGLSSA